MTEGTPKLNRIHRLFGENMTIRNKVNKSFLIKIFLILFTVSVSCTVLPYGYINTYGLFGQVTSVTVLADKEKSIQNTVREISIKEHNVKRAKGINIFNAWFAISVFIVVMSYIKYRFRLPREDNIVTLKVRMDH